MESSPSQLQQLQHQHRLNAEQQQTQQQQTQQQQFCLKWNSFGSNLASAFSNLFKSESLADVTLFCEGTTFRAHRLILAACSKHFSELFEAAPAASGACCVILEATSAANMAALLEFMYKGEVHVSQGALSGFLKAAESLQVKGLSIEHEKIAVAQQTQHGALTSPVRVKHHRFSHNNNNNTKDHVDGAAALDGLHAPAMTPYLHHNNYNRQYEHRLGSPYDTPRRKQLRSPVGCSSSDTNNTQQDGGSSLRCSVLRDGSSKTTSSSPNGSPKGCSVSSLDRDRGSPQSTHFKTELQQQQQQDEQQLNNTNETPGGGAYNSGTGGGDEDRDNEEDACSSADQGFAEDLRIKMETEYSPSAVLDGWASGAFSSSSSGNNKAAVTSAAISNNVLSGTGLIVGDNHTQSQLDQLNNTTGVSAVTGTPPNTTDLLSGGVWHASKLTGHKAGSVATADGKKLKCPYCERLYGYETNLRAHVRQRHQGIRVHCPFCTRTFTRNNTVRRHIAREHKQEMTLKQYQQTQQLTNHAATQ